MPLLFYPLPPEQVIEWPGTRPAGWAPHWGTDWPIPTGTPVRATSDGTIVYVGDDGLGGLTIDLVRGDGLLQRFGHLSEYRVALGQHVEAGRLIALSGNTGASTGPHLHWELRWDRLWSAGAWVDPRDLRPATFGRPVRSPQPSHQVRPANPLQKELPTMANPIGMYIGTTRPKNASEELCAIYDPESGFYTTFSGVSQRYINDMARAHGTRPFGRMTVKHWEQIKARLDEMRRS